MQFLQSKKSRRMLLFIGLPLFVIAAYIGYEVYTFNVEMNAAMQGVGKVMASVGEIMSAFSKVIPDSTAIDSTQVLTDSLLVK